MIPPLVWDHSAQGPPRFTLSVFHYYYCTRPATHRVKIESLKRPTNLKLGHDICGSLCVLFRPRPSRCQQTTLVSVYINRFQLFGMGGGVGGVTSCDNNSAHLLLHAVWFCTVSSSITLPFTLNLASSTVEDSAQHFLSIKEYYLHQFTTTCLDFEIE